jgi:hypothetical protein
MHGLFVLSPTGVQRLDTQSITHFDYLWYVFNLLYHYCHSVPFLVTKRIKGNSYFALQFETRALACLSDLSSIFIVNGRKVVPFTIFDLLTPIALAHWIRGEGFARNGGRSFSHRLLFNLRSRAFRECSYY